MPTAIALDSLPDAAASRARLDARILAARAFPPPPEPAPRPARVTATTVPELPAAALTGTRLREAIAENGALLVRGLLPTAQHAPLRSAIDRVLAADGSQGTPWFDPPPSLLEAMPARELATSRAFHRSSGSAMCAEAPAVAEHLLALYESLGLDTLAARCLDDRPCLSVKKWVLRRSHTSVEEAGWHQDGAFMGAGIQSVNLWLPLTDCGADTGAPGLDIIPARIDGLLHDGEGTFDWSVSPAFVKRELPPQESPRFAAGDALFFDHFFLHRTQYRPRFRRPRYAVETWFFAEGRAPANQVPLSWR
jgi:hypothetical protein